MLHPNHSLLLALLASTFAAPQVQHVPSARARSAQPWREQPLYVLQGAVNSSFPGFGTALDGGADVDLDGIRDLVIGSPYESPHGRARVFSGATGLPLLPPLEHPAAWTLAYSAALIGDLDGDGRSEILTGDMMLGGVGPGGKGQAFVFSGADGALLRQHLGDHADDMFGYRAAAAGDVDGDGVPDYAVGALADHSGAFPGYVRLFSGATGLTIRTYSRPNLQLRYGLGLANAGDVNGDARPDLLIGIPRLGAGVVEMRSGMDGSLLWQSNGPGTCCQDFGVSVAPVGDVNGDGELDVAASMLGSDLVRVLRASDGSFVADFGGPGADYFGGAILGLGDVNHDGHDDLAIGSKWTDSPTLAFAGATFLRSGADGSTFTTFYGEHVRDRFGITLASLGDVDGDGIADFAVGANQDGNSLPGYVAVYSGARP